MQSPYHSYVQFSHESVKWASLSQLQQYHCVDKQLNLDMPISNPKDRKQSIGVTWGTTGEREREREKERERERENRDTKCFNKRDTCTIKLPYLWLKTKSFYNC